MVDPELKTQDPPRALALVGIGLCLLFTLWLSLAGRADMLLYGDEYLSLANLSLSYGEAFGAYDDRGTGVGFLLLQKLSVDLLGPEPIAYRLPATLGALGAVLLIYPVGRSLVGGWAALAAAPLMTSASVFVHYARFGRAYSILVFLMLAYVWGLAQVARGTRIQGSLGRAVLILAGGLLPWFHLTTAPSLALLGLAGLWHLRREPDKLKSLLLSLGGAGLLSLLLMLPAREAMLAFFEGKVGNGRALEASALDVGALLFGTRWGAALVLGCALLAGGLFLRQRPPGWLLVLVAALTPLVAVLITRPSGAIYAFARYQISALPFLCLLAGWAVWSLVRRLHARSGVALGLSWALGAALFLGGPSWRDPAAFGPFAASNLSLYRLPAFDARWEGMPAFYSRLSELPGSARVLELPEQTSRSSLLYRNYWLTHRKDVSMGFMITHKSEKVPGGPHVNLREGQLAESGVDYVVYHKRIQEELTQFWIFVHAKAWNLETDADLMPFMQGHGNFGNRFDGRAVSRSLLEPLGDPFYEDRFLQVWKLR